MEQAELLRRISDALESCGIVYGFTGSHASSVYGEARFTNDIDVKADIRPAALQAFRKAFPESYFYVSDVAAAHAVASGGQFNIIHPESGRPANG